MTTETEHRRPGRPFWGFVVLIAALAAILYLPALKVGFLGDDLFQISLLEGLFGPASPLDLYTFGDADPENAARHIARGSLPWWTLPEWRFSMLRPLSSLLVAVDHWLWGPQQPLLHHLHGLVWMVACVFSAALLFSRLGSRLFAGAAVVVYAIDESFGWTIAWLANRCSMVAAAFVLLALALHVRRRQAARPSVSLGAVELGVWSLAFAAGEYALAGLGYVVAYELAFAQDRWRVRLRALLPAFAPALAFAITYVALDCGVTGGSTYIDPLAYPGEYLWAAVDRIPRISGEAWLGIPGEGERFWERFEDSGLSAWVLPLDGATLQQQLIRHARFSGLMTLAVWIPAWLSLRRYVAADLRRTVRFMTLGSLLSLPPLAAVPPVTRILALPSVGVAAAVGALVVGAVEAYRSGPRRPLEWVRASTGVIFAGLLLSLHVPVEAYFARAQLVRILETHDWHMKFYGAPSFRALDLEGKHVVVLATPGLVTGIHGLSMMRVLGYSEPRSWHVLAIGARPYLVRRLGPRALEIDSVGGPLHVSPLEVLFRPRSEALRLGEEVDAGLFRVRVLHERPHGPDALSFTFDRSLDDRSLVFLEVGENGFQPFALPPEGRSVAIKPPHLPTPLPR